MCVTIIQYATALPNLEQENLRDPLQCYMFFCNSSLILSIDQLPVIIISFISYLHFVWLFAVRLSSDCVVVSVTSVCITDQLPAHIAHMVYATRDKCLLSACNICNHCLQASLPALVTVNRQVLMDY